MQFPKALIRHQSHPGPLSSSSQSSTSENQRQSTSAAPTKTRNSLNHLSGRSSSVRDNRASKPRSYHRKQITPEDVQIQQLYLDAKRHQDATARVTHLKDFQTMTFTLPAAKTSPTRTFKQPKSDSPFRQCSLMSVLAPSSRNKQRKQNGESMFRGTKSWTSSAAAGSVIAEASQADRYYLNSSSSSKQPLHGRSTRSIAPRGVLDQIEEGEENKRRWTSLLTKRWTTHHRSSLAVEI